MNDWYVPVGVIGSYFTGALALMLYGWLESGEKFNLRKFGASFIVTVFISLQGAIGMLASDIILNTAGLIAYCLTAALAGFGTVEATSRIAKANTKASGTSSEAGSSTASQTEEWRRG